MADEIKNEAPVAEIPPTPEPPPAAPIPQRSSERVGLRVSLIPAEEMERKDPRHGFRLFLTVIVIFFLILGGIIGILWFFVNSNSQTVGILELQTADIDKRSKDLAPSVKEAKNTQARLKVLASILPQHRTGLKILTFLENNTFPDVSYSSLTVAENGTVNLTVKATSFEAYAAQVTELRAQSQLKSVIASGLTPQWGENNALIGVAFNLTLTFDPSIFSSSQPGK
jgi:hypothetical protein